MPKFVLLKAFKLTGVVNSNILYFYRSLIFDKRARQYPVEGLAVLGFCSIELTVRTFVSEGEFLFSGIKRRGTYAQFLAVLIILAFILLIMLSGIACSLL